MFSSLPPLPFVTTANGQEILLLSMLALYANFIHNVHLIIPHTIRVKDSVIILLSCLWLVFLDIISHGITSQSSLPFSCIYLLRGQSTTEINMKIQTDMHALARFKLSI
jgi:hypothetical protein